MTVLHKDDSRVLDIIDAGVENVIYKTCENEDMVSTIKKALVG